MEYNSSSEWSDVKPIEMNSIEIIVNSDNIENDKSNRKRFQTVCEIAVSAPCKLNINSSITDNIPKSNYLESLKKI